MKEFIINKTNENQRLDKYLKRILPASSNSFLYKMLRKKNIELNGKRAKGDEILKSGDSVKIFFSDDTFFKMSDSVKEDNGIYLQAYKSIKNIEIVFEHEDFMIVNKPEGVLTQKDKANVPSLNEWCIGYLLSKNFIDENTLKEFKPSVLNRLDRNTKGLVIFGKTLTGSQRLSDLIKKRDIKKYYFAKTECDGRTDRERPGTDCGEESGHFPGVLLRWRRYVRGRHQTAQGHCHIGNHRQEEARGHGGRPPGDVSLAGRITRSGDTRRLGNAELRAIPRRFCLQVRRGRGFLPVYDGQRCATPHHATD